MNALTRLSWTTRTAESGNRLPTSVYRSTALRCCAIAFCCLFDVCSSSAREKVPTVDRGTAFFESKVKPILEANCLKCHGGGAKVRGGLRLLSRASVLEGGDSGPAIDLDDPSESLLLEAINYRGYEMPPKGKLEQAKIDVLTKWVEMGLPWTPGKGGKEVPAPRAGAPVLDAKSREFWSFRPVVRPTPPRVADRSWVRTPVDAFILAKLEANGMKPNPPADKLALLRRMHYDLTGLPPTPAEVDAVLADESADTFERHVDRLLDSPRYGERWGRHWLDLVRFAETNSFERDGPKPNAWRYRDYVIDSFNRDKPYDQFIREQLAGDETPDPTPESLIATGYYRLGQWDDEPSDPLQAIYDELDDVLATTSQVFLGLTMNCARCHDHKLDPIPQADYYRLLAFFQDLESYGTRGDQRSQNQADISSPDLRERYERLDRRKAALRKRMTALEQAGIVKMPGPDQRKSETRERQKLLDEKLASFLDAEQSKRYGELKQQWSQLEALKLPPRQMALSVAKRRATPRPTHVLIRGNAHVEGKAVEPGFPRVLGAPDPKLPAPGAESLGRRGILAEWIASPNNPLTARVLVNRIWQHHFGRGIVRSPNNFGMKGVAPSHRELLDWLAAEFVERGMRLKPIHKLILTSSAYRMSSRGNPASLSADPENDLFWRHDMRRLDAEEIRDSILAVNGELGREMGGPGIYTEIPREVLAGQSQPGKGWGKSSASDRARRSVYIHLKRSLITPMMERFDVADTDTSCPVRFATTQPTQALTMLNSTFMHEEAAAFADRIRREAGAEPADQVRLALSLALSREPALGEIERGVRLMHQVASENETDAAALKYFCLVVLNLNEFVYLD